MAKSKFTIVLSPVNPGFALHAISPNQKYFSKSANNGLPQSWVVGQFEIPKISHNKIATVNNVTPMKYIPT